MFITEDDYKVVIGDTAMKVVSQASAENRANAEREAQEEISGYLRPKYDCDAVFAAEGDKRNRQIVMFTCDIALYHMVSAMPQKWVPTSERNAMSVPSSGWRVFSPERLYLTFP